ncbi:DUF485 domain-containing protein [uncultured Friedmanniella sp.]|uniref:DUF485 domain-containing protein n=1 Tax=uncultured Friedmanniella sp. TaxID=335381 RepID=UPI0035C9893E
MTESTPRPEAAERSPDPTHDDGYAAIAADPEFAELKRRYLRFAFPATLAFMAWYVTYVICNNWARDFLDTPVVGNINVAVVFGLLQFVSTFVIAFLYSRHARSALDPLATRLRGRFEQRAGTLGQRGRR